MTGGLLCVAFLISHFSFLICPAAAQVKVEFPYDGGTTSDGITVSNVKWQGFTKARDKNALIVGDGNDKSTVRFKVSVPKGKVASLKYSVALEITPIAMSGMVPEDGSIEFTVKMGTSAKKMKKAIHHKDNSRIYYQSDEVYVSGDQNVFIEATFTAAECRMVGSIDNLSVHAHDFSIVQLQQEAICGEVGRTKYTCSVCGKDSIVEVPPVMMDHVFEEYDTGTSSCLSNTGKVRACKYCPKTDISHDGELSDHDFSADGTCSVCRLHMPRCNADGTVYEINDAGEMRVLAEMVSMGRVSGNIGINVNNDLVFTKDITMLPLGTSDHPFQGVLNGRGHRIRGVVNTFQGIDCLGFVGVAKGTIQTHAVVANLIFDSGNSLAGTACVGGLVGYAENCDIVSCASFGTLTGDNFVGGIVGFAGQQVSIANCGAATTIRTGGVWNTMACGLSSGRILNSYGAASNVLGGTFDQLPQARLRHCFSSQGSADGLTLVSTAALSSYTMVQQLNAESQSPCFQLLPSDFYPVPVVNTDIAAQPNKSVAKARQTAWRRAPSTDPNDYHTAHEKDTETETTNGYVDKTVSAKVGRTIGEVLSQDSTEYAAFDRVYVATRRVPEGFGVYDRISGGQLLAFESYLLPADTSFIEMTEYALVSTDWVTPTTASAMYYAADRVEVDEYDIDDGNIYRLRSVIKVENNYDMVYQEPVNGIMKPVFRIKTIYDASGAAIGTNAYSYNQRTGEVRLEYSCQYDRTDKNANTSTDNYVEYLDSLDNTIHIISSYVEADDDSTVYRDHFILRAADQFPLEVRTEVLIDGTPYLVDGTYFIYDDNGALLQSVDFGPVDDDVTTSPIVPYMYYEYIGYWEGAPYVSAIKVPTVTPPPLKKRIDPNVYDMQGRVVRRATDMRNPFSALPKGIYIYQGEKFVKR